MARFGDLRALLDQPRPGPIQVTHQIVVFGDARPEISRCPVCGWALGPDACTIVRVVRAHDPRLPEITHIAGVRCATTDAICNAQEPA